MKARIAFDLDETLAVAAVDESSLRGFIIRPGCNELLEKLAVSFTLVIWSSSERSYLNRALNAGLGEYFEESYSWTELPLRWKDIRLIKAKYLVDDSDHHFLEAKKHGIEQGYIVVPAYGAPEDNADSLLWTKIVLVRLEPSS